MNRMLFILVGILLALACALPASAWKREKRHKEPHLPGVIHSGSCKELAPGVYDCGNHKNHSRTQNKRTGRWKVTVKPTDDITITARSKAQREFEQAQR